jgi:hypothetical protein
MLFIYGPFLHSLHVSVHSLCSVRSTCIARPVDIPVFFAIHTILSLVLVVVGLQYSHYSHALSNGQFVALVLYRIALYHCTTCHSFVC